MKLLLSFLLLFSASVLLGQNQTNENGRRVGYWVINADDAGKSGYPAGAKYREGNYENGRKVGTWKTYYSNGQLKSVITFENGRPKGPYTTYYFNGQIEENGNWSLNKNYGGFTRYYEDGTLQQEFEFNDSGKRTGTQKYYHPNGQLAINGNWDGGKESGEVKEFYEDGSVKSVRVFNDGTMDPAQTKRYEPKTPVAAVKKEPEPLKDDNNKVITTQVVNKAEEQANIGIFDGNGQHTLYNRNRQISQKGLFKDGRLVDGKIYRYNRDGILIKIEMYQGGKYIGEGVIEDDMK